MFDHQVNIFVLTLFSMKIVDYPLPLVLPVLKRFSKGKTHLCHHYRHVYRRCGHLQNRNHDRRNQQSLPNLCYRYLHGQNIQLNTFF